MKFKINFSIMVILAFLSSCEEDNIFGPDQGEQEEFLSQSLLNAQARSIEVYNLVDLVYRDSIFRRSDSTFLEGAKATRKGSTTRIDFIQGGVGSDGEIRAGAIILNHRSGSTDLLQAGAKFNGQFDNYRVSGDTVRGTFTIENLSGQNFALDYQNFSVENATSYTSSHQIQWQNGYSTQLNPLDDRYAISNTSELIDSITFDRVNSSIGPNNPLIFSRICEYGIEEGLEDLRFTGDSLEFNTGSIDFLANDTCNNVADFTLVGDQSTITQAITFKGF